VVPSLRVAALAELGAALLGEPERSYEMAQTQAEKVRR
jgi:hypothetical protein